MDYSNILEPALSYLFMDYSVRVSFNYCLETSLDLIYFRFMISFFIITPYFETLH